jgi:hypothetical protein
MLYLYLWPYLVEQFVTPDSERNRVSDDVKFAFEFIDFRLQTIECQSDAVIVYVEISRCR